ncbi:amidohydrolase family protein [Algibacter amylolyticus]|uniref:Amidohydrolase family protein n=1 Tax=Algibacter amylolyticus TaxID=1608400 RepID=A0A5M7B1D2_9FLAO|nr:amidohydrolase family protein [Algibacter amylolyticus]KAA5823319.1 amidohydrolase family protein [Algibacter amylolyticus]MBB5267461.1 N-acetylglucosamine-6-phosphate deacetylase [Algibacter amylolyticus]TSJ73807.1 amidohydrolase family protein [Algibacter amylolyticus]
MNFKALDYRTNEPITVEVEGGYIKNISKCEQRLEHSYYIAPGLVDLQVNGYKGIDLNSLDLKVADVNKICEDLLEEGITSFLPTIITNSDESTTYLLKIVSRACNESFKTNESIGGIHLEGPFISLEDGPRGAHSKAFVKAPNWELFTKWQNAANGKIRIITLSPEWPESIEFIKNCVASGVIVSIGHTAASPKQIQDAIKAGATMSTHLGNASHAMLPRHNNYIFEQLASDDLWASIIADGFHLPDALLNIFLKTKPDKSILVSDTTSFAGLPTGNYKSHIGGEITLDASGKLHMQGNPYMLAGSAQSLLWCVNQLINKNIASLKDAWHMASIKPTEILFGTSNNLLQVGQKANLVIFEKTDNGLEVIKTIQSADIVYSNPNKN